MVTTNTRYLPGNLSVLVCLVCALSRGWGDRFYLKRLHYKKFIRITHSRKIAKAVECGDRGCG